MNNRETENRDVNIQPTHHHDHEKHHHDHERHHTHEKIQPSGMKDLSQNIGTSSGTTSSSMQSSSMQSGMQSGMRSGIESQMSSMPSEHLQASSMFEKPMKDYFFMVEDLSRIFSITSAIKMKIFDTLDEMGSGQYFPIKDIIEKLKFKTSIPQMSIYLDELMNFGYLERDGMLESARYRCSDYTRNYLLRKVHGSYAYVYLNMSRYMSNFNNVESTFPYNKTHMFTDDMYKDDEHIRMFTDYFYKANLFNFDNLIKCCDFSKFKRICDLRGVTGYGCYLIKKTHPTSEVICFDSKYLKPKTEEYLQSVNMKDLVKFESGDPLKDYLPKNCDCFVAPFLFSHYNSERKEKLGKNIFDSLEKGGCLVIMENLFDENRSKNSCALQQSFMMEVCGYEGFEESFAQCRTCLLKLGFRDVEHVYKGNGMADIIMAWK